MQGLLETKRLLYYTLQSRGQVLLCIWTEELPSGVGQGRGYKLGIIMWLSTIYIFVMAAHETYA